MPCRSVCHTRAHIPPPRRSKVMRHIHLRPHTSEFDGKGIHNPFPNPWLFDSLVRFVLRLKKNWGTFRGPAFRRFLEAQGRAKNTHPRGKRTEEDEEAEMTGAKRWAGAKSTSICYLEGLWKSSVPFARQAPGHKIADRREGYFHFFGARHFLELTAHPTLKHSQSPED